MGAVAVQILHLLIQHLLNADIAVSEIRMIVIVSPKCRIRWWRISKWCQNRKKSYCRILCSCRSGGDALVAFECLHRESLLFLFCRKTGKIDSMSNLVMCQADF